VKEEGIGAGDDELTGREKEEACPYRKEESLLLLLKATEKGI
jgi:hypothetical protein